MAPNGSRTAAIVGGGAIGAALFCNLVGRLVAEKPSRSRHRIVLFERSERIGPGLAYGRDEAPYLLNQSASTMSVVPGNRRHFCEWLEARGVTLPADEELFCFRQVFGDYLEESFARALEKARHAGIVVSTIHGEVSALTARRCGGYRVITEAHAPIEADIVVLALGNLPSRKLCALEGPGFVASPYPSTRMCAAIPKAARVAILGSGLSAIDAATALFAAGHRAPVTMASRNGLLPAVRGPLRPCDLHYVTRANIARATDHRRSPLRLSTVVGWLELELARHGVSVSWDRDFPAWADPLERLEAQVAAAQGGARMWQSIGEALNPMIELVWHHLEGEDKRLFVDRFYSRFMSHWVPIPLVTASRILPLLREGRLMVERGLEGVELDSSTGTYRARFPDRVTTFDFVIDATGVPRRLSDCDSQLLRSLLQQGTIAAHPSAGLQVDFESLRVVGADGRLDSGLFAIGNLTSGTHLFTSTLEFNVQKADRVAARIAVELVRRSEKDHHADSPSDPT